MSLVDGLLNQKIDSIVSVTKDGYGDETQTTVFTKVPCRWQNTVETITTRDNETVTTTAKVWLFPSYNSILYSYQIVQDSITYNIKLIKNVVDLDGNLDHIVVYLV